MYLQAYETLRTAKDHLGLSPFGAGEEDKIKEKLITFTKQLYERANNFEGALDTYSNYSLMCSGALGLAACIFANGNYGHPYSIFDRNNGYSTEQTIQNLRVRLIKESDYQNDMDKPVFLAYKQVYDSAMLPRPVDDGMITYNALGKPTIPSRLALWAKNNAFVMLVGLNGNGDTLSLAARDSCKSRVLETFWEELRNFIIAL